MDLPKVILNPAAQRLQPGQLEELSSLKLFSNPQLQVLAICLIRTCQRLGTWGPVTAEALQNTWHEGDDSPPFSIQGLTEGVFISVHPHRKREGGGYLVETEVPGTYLVTVQFVEACDAAARRRADARRRR
jgi:hypothetical protein